MSSTGVNKEQGRVSLFDEVQNEIKSEKELSVGKKKQEAILQQNCMAVAYKQADLFAAKCEARHLKKIAYQVKPDPNVKGSWWWFVEYADCKDLLHIRTFKSHGITFPDGDIITF